MGHYITVTIDALCKKSEFAEIIGGFESKAINWNLDMRINSIYGRKPLIGYSYKLTPTPSDIGYIENLSEMFPLVSFSRNSEYEDPDAEEDYYDWYCCGRKCESTKLEDLLEEERNNSAHRFMQSDSKRAFGLYHQLHCSPKGTVEALGRNIFGECNSQEWTGVCAVACGDWHSVALRNDGSLLACGSNANKQCNVSDLSGAVSKISCGRYHTALLAQDGTVTVRGRLEHVIEDKFLERSTTTVAIKYPVICTVEGPSSKKRNRQIENTKVGDLLELRIDEDNPSYYPVGIEVLNGDGESLGYLEDNDLHPLTLLAHDLAKIEVHADTVTPLSAQYPGARYALLTVRLDESDIMNPGIPKYQQIPHRSWRDIVDICSVHDAVIGKNIHGKILVDGDPGCTTSDLNEFLMKRFGKQED